MDDRLPEDAATPSTAAPLCAFERVDFSPRRQRRHLSRLSREPPAYGQRPTRGGSRLNGRLVFDLDESEIIETLDAPFEGVDYSLPFELLASIVPAGNEERGVDLATLTLSTTTRSCNSNVKGPSYRAKRPRATPQARPTRAT